MNSDSGNKSSVCFFCCKMTESGDSKSEISTFFNSSTQKNDSVDDAYRSASTVISEKPKTCISCEEINKTFCGLFHHVKELEMRIDWEIGKLCDKMVDADSRKSFPEKDEIECTTIAASAEVTLAVFRKHSNKASKSIIILKI